MAVEREMVSDGAVAHRTRWDCPGERRAPQSRTRRGAGRHRQPVQPRGLPWARTGRPRVGDRRASTDTGPEGRLRPEPLAFSRDRSTTSSSGQEAMRPAIDRVATEVSPGNEVRDHRRRPRRFGASPEERAGPLVQRRASRLSGRPPGCACADAYSRGKRWSARSVASGCRPSSGGLPATRQAREEPIHASRR